MNKRTLSIIGLVALGVLLFWTGTLYGQPRFGANGWMMNDFNGNGAFMMDNNDGFMNGSGLMNNGNSMMNGFSMMGNGSDMMNGFDMMGNVGGLVDVEPLTIEAAETAVNRYLTALDNDALTLGEVMIFDNHAYAQIMDGDQGAFEVLVDPTTSNVLPEPGPNMMWNTDYSLMNNMGMMGGNEMMGQSRFAPNGEISVTPAEAVELAQQYLTITLPDTTAGKEADVFPGYYTLHIERDSDIVGMLSVNAFTGQVFPHHWHGDFIALSDEAH